MGLGQVPQSGQRTIYGVPPDLPPRIDRASKPSGLVIPTSPIRNGSAAKNSSIHSIATLNRSSQDRLFSPSKMNGDGTHGGGDQEEYASRNQLMANKQRMNGNSLERNQASLDRQTRPTSNSKMGNESYDSVSSYDSYNTGPNMRLGPNTPDDLKSAPMTNTRPGPADYVINSPSKALGHHAHPSMDYTRPPVAHHPELARSLSSGPNDINRGSYGNGNPMGDPHMGRGGQMPQRPTNLGLEPSPRKMLPFEAKTDYGKYRCVFWLIYFVQIFHDKNLLDLISRRPCRPQFIYISKSDPSLLESLLPPIKPKPCPRSSRLCRSHWNMKLNHLSQDTLV